MSTSTAVITNVCHEGPVCLHLQLAVTGGQTYSLSEAVDFEVREFKMLLISLFFLKREREFTSIL